MRYVNITTKILCFTQLKQFLNAKIALYAVQIRSEMVLYCSTK